MNSGETILVGLAMLQIASLLWNAGRQYDGVVQGVAGVLFMVLGMGKVFSWW